MRIRKNADWGNGIADALLARRSAGAQNRKLAVGALSL